MLYVYHYSSEAFLTLLPISVVILILAGTGNIFILRQSYKRYRAKKFVSDLLIFACCMCNMVTCFLGLPLHIVKLVVDHFEDKKTSSYLCVFRYGIISSTTNYSLLMLTVLILSRKDKILQISSGKNSLIHKKYNSYTDAGISGTTASNFNFTHDRRNQSKAIDSEHNRRSSNAFSSHSFNCPYS